MLTLQQIKIERLRAQTERDLIMNELIKGTLVRWEDVMAVMGPKVAAARNALMALPSQYADKLSREEVEQFRKDIHAALVEMSKIGSEEVKAQNKKMARFTKKDSTLDPEKTSQSSIISEKARISRIKEI